MRAFRPSRFEECEASGPNLAETKEARIFMYQRLAEQGVPLFDDVGAPVSWPEVREGQDASRREAGYRLASECLETGRVTLDQYTFPSHEVARMVAIAMDALWPKIHHRPVPAKERQAEETHVPPGIESPILEGSKV
jgi:hypothetical protein